MSVDRDIPLLELANSSKPEGQDLRAQLRCREDQRLDSDRVDVELDRVCSGIRPVGPLRCLAVRNAETIRECIATALAPKKRIGVCPNGVQLTAKKKVCIELVCLGGALIRLDVE